MTGLRQISSILTIAYLAQVDARSVRSAGTSSPIICNLAWSNSGHAKHTDCSDADVIFSSANDRSSAVRRGLNDPDIISMAYLSVGTVNQDFPADSRLSDYAWQRNEDSNGHGGLWGDDWYDPDDLVDKILPIMKELMDEYKAVGFNMISTDNAKPSNAVTDHDSNADKYRKKHRIDPRYIEYMHGIVDYAHSIDMQVALKNPAYYVNEPDLIGKFDAYLVESLFNWYPWDVDVYNDEPNLLTGSAPFWVFQYEGVNGLENDDLRDRMSEQGVDMVYLDSDDGWVKFYADEDYEPSEHHHEHHEENVDEVESSTDGDVETYTTTETSTDIEEIIEPETTEETDSETDTTTSSDTETETENTQETESETETETENTQETESETDDNQDLQQYAKTVHVLATDAVVETVHAVKTVHVQNVVHVPAAKNTAAAYNQDAYNSVIALMEKFYGNPTPTE